MESDKKQLGNKIKVTRVPIISGSSLMSFIYCFKVTEGCVDLLLPLSFYRI